MYHTLFSTSLTAYIFTGSEPTIWQTPPMRRKRQKISCHTHPHRRYYTTTKTRTQGTIVHQAKTYAPHKLEIIYHRTIIVPATLRDHKDKNIGNNSLPRQRTKNPTILNYYCKTTTLHILNTYNLLYVTYIYGK